MQRLKHAPLYISLVLIAGCQNQSMDDLEQFIQETKIGHHGKVDPLPTFPEYESFVYSSEDVRDPFRPRLEAQTTTLAGDNAGPRPVESRAKQPLESYPIDSLKMVGLLEQSAQTWGLVRDPEGTIHRVQPGDYAGQNHGKITNVSESRIDIVELVPDGLSGWINRQAQLAMTED